AEEILDLKAQIKKAKDPDLVAELKHRVMAFENRIRAVEARQRTRDIETQHKQKEKELIRTGQKAKPYYLKPSEIKKLAETERLESMGKKARDKSMKRKQKREKSKESSQMPRVRRE
ncbi:MAG: rRNA biogenesis protein rrp36, partial [Watsoniomyces obsoletus]